MSAERITITEDGADIVYVRSDLVPEEAEPPGPWAMFIIDNGWIIIGKADGHSPGGGRVIIDPWCVRSYGEGEGITAIGDASKCTYEKWPGASVTIDKGRTVSVNELPESFDGPR